MLNLCWQAATPTLRIVTLLQPASGYCCKGTLALIGRGSFVGRWGVIARGGCAGGRWGLDLDWWVGDNSLHLHEFQKLVRQLPQCLFCQCGIVCAGKFAERHKLHNVPCSFASAGLQMSI